jgi:hypothetical protein
LKDSFYVDYLVTGEQTPEHALSLYEASSNNLASGGSRLGNGSVIVKLY